MIGFTKERIEQFIKNPLEHGLTRSEQMEMARQLLASMEQEPVYQACKEAGVWVDIDPGDAPSLRANGEQVRVLYAAPQLPQPAVVPDAIEIDDDFDSAFEHGKAVGWNAYRAAMLQGAEPVIQPNKLRDGWVAVPVEPTQEMLDSYEHDAMPAVFIDSMRERARMSRRHSWRAFLRAAPKLEVAQPPQSESQDSTVTVYPWLVSLMVLDKDLREFIPYCFYILKNNDGLLTRSDFESLLKEQVKEHIGDRNYTITFFGKVDPYQAPQQEIDNG